jgi:methanethiol S-methyltransferase
VRLLAWAGGALFVGSLGYLVFFYAVVLAAPSGDPALTVRNAFINVALFSVFALHHSLLARAGAKARVARMLPPGFERLLYVWIASLLLLAVCALWQPVPGTLYQLSGWRRVPFWALQLAGGLVILRAAAALGPLELAGIRHATGRPSRDTLTFAGPFRLVRHPIYLGWMLMVFLAPTMTVNRLLFAAISSTYLILAIPWEEKSLVATHGDAYRDYQRLVPWRVVPRVW